MPSFSPMTYRHDSVAEADGWPINRIGFFITLSTAVGVIIKGNLKQRTVHALEVA